MKILLALAQSFVCAGLFGQMFDGGMPPPNGNFYMQGPVNMNGPNGGVFYDDSQAVMAERQAIMAERQAARERERAAREAAAAQNTENRPPEPPVPPHEADAKKAEDKSDQADGAETTAAEAAQTPPPPQKTRRELLVDSLLERNPFFASQSRRPGAVQQAPQGLELRSISCINGKWFFGIADTAQNKRYVVPLGRQGAIGVPYIIDFYDDETNSISISDSVGCYTLTLKESENPTGRPVAIYGGGAPAKKRAQAPAPRRGARR